MNAESWALVTGASSGLGREFARVLAQRKTNLVLVARRQAPMQELAKELEGKHGIKVLTQSLDLAETNSAAILLNELDRHGISVDILVNNAAFGLSSEFLAQEVPRIQEMLMLDIVSLVTLTHVFGRRMKQRGQGHILLVGSLAAYQPTPLMAAYGAAKSFVLAFGEALHVELAPMVGVTVVSPGLMETEFFEVSGYTPKESLKRSMLPASEVARAGIAAMFDRKSNTVVGRLNKIAAFSTRLFPRHIQAGIVYRMTKG